MTKSLDSYLFVPVSVGELIDKKTILEIKRERIRDTKQVANVERELELLSDIAAKAFATAPDAQSLQQLEVRLKEINMALWDLENTVRAHERSGDFGESFTRAARAIYAGNDNRAKVKREINLLTGSSIVEEKSHT